MVIPDKGVADPGLSREVGGNPGDEGGATAIFCIILIPMQSAWRGWARERAECAPLRIPKVKIVKNPSMFLHHCTLIMHRRLHSISQW